MMRSRWSAFRREIFWSIVMILRGGGREVSINGIITEDEADEPTNPALVKSAFFSLAVLFAFLGVRSMLKKNKES